MTDEISTVDKTEAPADTGTTVTELPAKADAVVTADTPAKPESLLDTVKAGLAKQADPDAVTAAVAAKPNGEDKTKTALKPEDAEKDYAAAKGEEKVWLSKAEYAALPERVRQRFGQLTTRAKEADEKVRGFETSVKDMTPRAQSYDKVRGYLDTNRISQNDFSWGLQFLALLKANPAKAWEHLSPVVEQLQTYRGEKLPDDLAAEVEAGTLNAERAKELALARNEKARLMAEGTARGEADARASEVRMAQDGVKRVTDSLGAWEQTWKANDPDYPKLWKQVWANLRVKLDGQNPTPEQAVALAEAAKKEVQDFAKGLLPSGAEMRPVVGSGAVTPTQRQPSSYLDAAKIALANMRA